MNDRTCRCHPRAPFAQGFTLIELLTVLAIISVFVTLSGMAFSGSMKSQQLRTTAQQLSADLDFVTLLARKENRPVDVFFFKSPSQEFGGPEAIRAYRYGILTGFETNGQPIYRFLVEPKRLPPGMVASSDVVYSSLLKLPVRPALIGKSAGLLEPHTFYSYQVRPDGTTTLDQNEKHTITLLWEKDLVLNKPPQESDTRTVTIDPTTSRARVY